MTLCTRISQAEGKWGVWTEPVTGDPTFIMLGTVREYAHEHLEAAGEALVPVAIT